MTKDDFGPFHPPSYDDRGYVCHGSSFRAVAAMHAMAAIISEGASGADTHEHVVKEAVKFADALIAELKK